jgi:hypothetical protein
MKRATRVYAEVVVWTDPTSNRDKVGLVPLPKTRRPKVAVTSPAAVLQPFNTDQSAIRKLDLS